MIMITYKECLYCSYAHNETEAEYCEYCPYDNKIQIEVER